MKKQLVIGSLVMALCAPTVIAADKKTGFEDETFIGLSGGMVTGAVVAGPVGAIVGATLGALLGENEKNKDQRLVLNEQLAIAATKQIQAEQKSIQLLAQVQQLELNNTQLNQRIQIAQRNLNHMDKLEQLKLNLQFKSSSSQVEDFYLGQIEHLSMLMKANPDLKITLSGYADRNGEEGYNQNLSELRVDEVKRLLISKGVAEHNINTQAFGESSPMQASQDYQNDFYDRRVEIRFQPNQVLTAKK